MAAAFFVTWTYVKIVSVLLTVPAALKFCFLLLWPRTSAYLERKSSHWALFSWMYSLCFRFSCLAWLKTLCYLSCTLFLVFMIFWVVQDWSREAISRLLFFSFCQSVPTTVTWLLNMNVAGSVAVSFPQTFLNVTGHVLTVTSRVRRNHNPAVLVWWLCLYNSLTQWRLQTFAPKLTKVVLP